MTVMKRYCCFRDTRRGAVAAGFFSMGFAGFCMILPFAMYAVCLVLRYQLKTQRRRPRVTNSTQMLDTVAPSTEEVHVLDKQPNKVLSTVHGIVPASENLSLVVLSPYQPRQNRRDDDPMMHQPIHVKSFRQQGYV